MAPDILSYGRRPRRPRTSVGQSPPHRPSCDSPPPSPRRHRHRCLASHRGPLPLGPRPDAAPAPVPVPLFRPLEANPGMGLLPPRYQYAPSGNFFKKSFPGNYPPDRTQGENLSREKSDRVTRPSGGESRSSMGHPYIILWPTPDRRLLVPRMTVSPLSFTLFPWVWGAIWGWPRLDDLAQHSSGAAAFQREIVHTEFEGNPRVPDGIEMQLSEEYQNNIFWHGVAER